ncbi:heme biosynthesis protein HemY [Phenylobacterium terrae]|uniref:Heme biosynthesis protein HemY n=1 Tax=Phenylobacterium terrae TaxID=2665495 RepID=A0ABW4N0A4_9CAUL
MIRAALAFVLVAGMIVAILAVTGEPGRASLIWLGWRADMTAATAALLILGFSLAATIVWRLALWIIESPRRAARVRAEIRRRQANEVLTRGFLAVAAADGSEARRLAAKAADLADDTPGLVRVLAALAADVAGDSAAAHSAYTAMLSFPEMRLAGHKGLMMLAADAGQRDSALAHAEAAYALPRTARWAWRALLEARLEAGDWDGALDLVRSGVDRKVVSPLVAERARAALLAASAARLEADADPKARAQALDRAGEAAKLQPGFAPGVVMAARLLARDGKAQRAAGLIEGAWKAAPHPALWLAYRDLRTDETPRQRAERLAGLVALNPHHRESRILAVEQALIAGDPQAARESAKALQAEPITARTAGLFARLAYAARDPDEARMWTTRGLAAPQEADWSDLDPEGRAFAYQPGDWARLVSAFAESGELIHPRLERRERTMTELPELPALYADSAPLLGAADLESLLYPGAYDGYDEEAPEPPPPAPAERSARSSRLSTARRRLANAPRAAK